jgi:hypothetical protein
MMGYPRDLDEYTEDELIDELNKRIGLHEKGKCGYCERKPTTTPCKFPDRHHDKRIVGIRVRMTAAFKAANREAPLAVRKLLDDDAQLTNVEEFGDCVGKVDGLVDWGDGPSGPEVDVRWEPSNLRYAYATKDLEVVKDER